MFKRVGMFALLSVFAASLAVPALAQGAGDALAPGAEADAPAPLDAAFPSAFKTDVRLRALDWQINGGMYSEAIGTKSRGGKFYVFYDRNPRFAWADIDTDKIAHKGVTAYCEVEVPAATARSLETVWNAALKSAAKPKVAPDPTSIYYITSLTGGKPVTALLQTVAGPRTKAFYALIDAMDNVCVDKGKASIAALKKQVDAMK